MGFPHKKPESVLEQSQHYFQSGTEGKKKRDWGRKKLCSVAADLPRKAKTERRDQSAPLFLEKMEKGTSRSLELPICGCQHSKAVVKRSCKGSEEK